MLSGISTKNVHQGAKEIEASTEESDSVKLKVSISTAWGQ